MESIEPNPTQPVVERSAPTGLPTVVFAGGGTGGHLFPGIAVAEALKERGVAARYIFVGSSRAVEQQIVTRHGFEHVALPVESTAVLWRSPVRFANRMWKSARVAREFLPECKASIVVGLGGFASVPVVWAARSSGIPMIILEQNAVPGRATSWLSPRADLTCLGFAEAGRRLPDHCRQLVTGNPVRAEISALAASGPSNEANRTLLVLGGSQGSAALNEAFLACVENQPQDFAGWKIVHQTGRRDVEAVRLRYSSLGIDACVAAFFEEMALHYCDAGLAVARAGALTLSELACAGVPAVLVPYRKAVRNHQRLNAYSFEHVGAARVVRQSVEGAVTSANLQEQLRLLMTNDALRGRMSRAIRSLARPHAASLVAEQVNRLLCGERPAVNTESRPGDK
jgi:UDP-N-acetylglucosamine--N-acetylmuramyl-(pentapeptide) pyrophosphoryl-undecaprenol N-acetylglucosamine transferase